MEKEEKLEKIAESQEIRQEEAEEAEKSVCEEKAVASHETPKAPEDREWDADAAEARIREWAGGPEKENINWGKYSQAFAWYDSENPENFGSYKLPHHDIIDGRLVVVWRGVAAAMAALMGARGGVDIPAQDRRAVYNHLARHYRQFEREPPEFAEVLLAPIELKIDRMNAKLNVLLESAKTEEEKQDEQQTEKVEEESSETKDDRGNEVGEGEGKTELDEGLEKEEEAEAEQEKTSEEASEPEAELTKDALIERFKQLRRQGYSQRDAWRLVALETIEKACKASGSILDAR